MIINTFNTFLKTLEGYYAKAPNLPSGGREFLVTVAPWFALIFGILIILASLSAFGIGAVSSPLVALGGTMTLQLMAAAAFGFIEGVIMVLAFSPLRNRLMRGWMLLVWVQVVSFVGSIFTLSLGSVVWSFLVVAVMFYLLFQIKPYYK